MKGIKKCNFIKNVVISLIGVLVVLGCFTIFEKKVLAADSDIVNIPDANFKEYLNYELGVDDLSADITVGQMKKITNISLADWDEVIDITGIKYCENLIGLYLNDCDDITSISELSYLSNLTNLRLYSCNKITNITPISNLTNLKELDLSNYHGVLNLSELSNLTNLTSLILYNIDDIYDLSGLGNLPNLTSLDISYCNGIESVYAVGNLKKLTNLDMAGCTGVTDISALKNLTTLTKLDLYNCISIRDISPITGLTALTELNLGDNRLDTIPGLGNLVNLTYLGLFSSDAVINISELSNLTKLTSLNLSACNNVVNASKLGNLKTLEKLNLDGCVGITDFSFVSQLPNLKGIFGEVGTTKTEMSLIVPSDVHEYTIVNDVKDDNGNYIAPVWSTLYSYDSETNEITLNLDEFDNSFEYITYEFTTYNDNDYKLNVSHKKIVNIERKDYKALKGTLEKAEDKEKYYTGNKITLNAIASEGSGDYKYKFAVLNVDSGKWYVLRDFNSSNTYTYSLDYPGKKQFAVTVKDSDGNTVATNRITVDVAKNVSAKLTVAGSTNALTKEKGSKITLTPVVSGGSGKYTYKYAVLNVDTGKWSVLKDFSDTKTYTYALNYPGKKQFAVTVKDSAGNTVGTNRITVTVYEKLSAKLTVSGSTQDLTKAKGSKITLTPVVTGGMGGYTYKFAVLNVDTGKWTVLKDFSSTKTYTYALNYPGKKQFAVTVKDSKGNTVATNRINVTVK